MLKQSPKVVLIGAGSVSFGLMTIRDMMRCRDMHGARVTLVDIDADKLDRMLRLSGRMNETWNARFEFTATTDRREALPGADLVVVAVERDRYRLWNMDREIPRKYGVTQLESENGGPGGLFHTLRQVPILLDIGRDMEQLCPSTWLINMSNPESRLTLALYRYTSIKNVGVCLGAYITQNNLARVVLGRQQEEIDIKVAGINHCHWVMQVRDAKTGEDLYPEVRRRIEQVDPSWEPLSRECLRRFGLFPGPADGHVSEYLGWGPEYLPESRGAERIAMFEKMAAEQGQVVDELIQGEGPLDDRELKPLLIEGGLRWQTLDLMLSLLDNGNRYILSLNIPNDGYIPNLKSDSIVEIPVIVGADQIYGLGVGELPAAIAAVMELQLRIMDLVVEAAVTGDRQTALQALIIDPAVPNPATAEKILDEMMVAQAEYLPQFS